MKFAIDDIGDFIYELNFKEYKVCDYDCNGVVMHFSRDRSIATVRQDFKFKYFYITS